MQVLIMINENVLFSTIQYLNQLFVENRIESIT